MRAYGVARGNQPSSACDTWRETSSALFEKELGLKSILMGFGLDSDAIHSPNEHYGLFNFFKGIETIPLFFKYFSQ